MKIFYLLISLMAAPVIFGSDIPDAPPMAPDFPSDSTPDAPEIPTAPDVIETPKTPSKIEPTTPSSKPPVTPKPKPAMGLEGLKYKTLKKSADDFEKAIKNNDVAAMLDKYDLLKEAYESDKTEMEKAIPNIKSLLDNNKEKVAALKIKKAEEEKKKADAAKKIKEDKDKEEVNKIKLEIEKLVAKGDAIEPSEFETLRGKYNKISSKVDLGLTDFKGIKKFIDEYLKKHPKKESPTKPGQAPKPPLSMIEELKRKQAKDRKPKEQNGSQIASLSNSLQMLNSLKGG